MKISKAIDFCLQYQKANSKNNTVKNYEFVLGKFGTAFNGRELGSIKQRRLFLSWPNSPMAKSKIQNGAAT